MMKKSVYLKIMGPLMRPNNARDVTVFSITRKRLRKNRNYRIPPRQENKYHTLNTPERLNSFSQTGKNIQNRPY